MFGKTFSVSPVPSHPGYTGRARGKGNNPLSVKPQLYIVIYSHGRIQGGGGVLWYFCFLLSKCSHKYAKTEKWEKKIKKCQIPQVRHFFHLKRGQSNSEGNKKIVTPPPPSFFLSSKNKKFLAFLKLFFNFPKFSI